ncbi:glycosyltransferase family 9 protein [Helicobacter sp. 23-1045]
MTILLHRAIKIGDNVVAIRAIYAIKALFPSANLIVATNNIGANLYANLPFIDNLLNVEANPNAIYDIPNIDFFISTHRNTANIAIAKATNAKKIIIRAHLLTLLSPRFINDYNFSTKMRPESDNLLRLVRLIDKRAFDSKIKSVDFSGAKLRFTRQNSDFVENFLAQVWQNQMRQNANGGGKIRMLRMLVSVNRANQTNLMQLMNLTNPANSSA